VSVCVFTSRSKEHHISRRVLLVIDRSNVVGSWVVRVEELESDVSFLNFFSERFFLHKGPLFLHKNILFIRVDRRVIGVEEFESDVSF
jgi:hypothetical protein